MTCFEIIVLVLIYCFCYGYSNYLLRVENETFVYTLLRIIWSFIIAFYIPVIIGYHLGNKLNE